MRRPLIVVLAVASLTPLLTLSATAQGSGTSILVEDLKAQCASEVAAAKAQAQREGTPASRVDAELNDALGPFVGADAVRSRMQEMADNAEAYADNDALLTRFLRCIARARIAQIDNGNRPVIGPAPASGAPASASSSDGGYTATLDHSGRVVSSSGSPSAGASQTTPASAQGGRMTGDGASVPDSNSCIQIVESGPTTQCRAGDPSMAVRIKNGCTHKVYMQACTYNTQARTWRCGSGSGVRGADVLTYQCQTDGRYLYAGCTEAAWLRGKGVSCGGDPNKQGY